MNSLTQNAFHISEEIRVKIEKCYLVPINTQARLEQVIHDPLLYQDPEHYPPFLPITALSITRMSPGRSSRCWKRLMACSFLPARLTGCNSWGGYGVLLAYLHDIGMNDFSHFGRATHPGHATQTIFQPEFDDIFQTIWEENAANLAWRLVRLADEGLLEQDPQLVLREMLSMVNCHSKSWAPVKDLNDPELLRQLM